MSRMAFIGARTRNSQALTLRLQEGLNRDFVRDLVGQRADGPQRGKSRRPGAMTYAAKHVWIPGFYLARLAALASMRRPADVYWRRVQIMWNGALGTLDPGGGDRKDGAVKRNLLIGATFVVALVGLGVTERALEQTAAAQAKSGVQVPIFEVDPFWPKTMPNNWVFGQTIGLGIDEKDQVWIIHRGNDPGNLDGTEFAHPPAGQGAEGPVPRGRRPPARRRGQRMLRSGAAGRRLRPGRQRRAQLGRARRCIPTGRTRTTASSSTTRASSGSAATAVPTRTS